MKCGIWDLGRVILGFLLLSSSLRRWNLFSKPSLQWDVLKYKLRSVEPVVIRALITTLIVSGIPAHFHYAEEMMRTFCTSSWWGAQKILLTKTEPCLDHIISDLLAQREANKTITNKNPELLYLGGKVKLTYFKYQTLTRFYMWCLYV